MASKEDAVRQELAKLQKLRHDEQAWKKQAKKVAEAGEAWKKSQPSAHKRH